MGLSMPDGIFTGKPYEGPGAVLTTLHGDLALPAFLPDATRGVLKSLDSADMIACGVSGLVVNAFHLQSHPGISVVSALGGIHAFMNWPRPVMSDSGGFQVFSLIGESDKLGSVTSKGVRFRRTKGAESRLLTPAKSIQAQFKIGADVLVCLDYCTRPEASRDEEEKSVELTVLWARMCKAEYERRADETRRKPLLFAVVQGGGSPELRRRCAEQLLEIGFDGYGFGGWPLTDEGQLSEMVHFTAELIPAGYPKWGLGIGNPRALVEAAACGYNLFDCVIPTRDARHRRLYIFKSKPEDAPRSPSGFYDVVHIQDEKHNRDSRPLDSRCDCLCCRNYSRAYLHHLFQIRDALALRLATIHNLRFYTMLLEALRAPSAARDERARG